MIARWLLSIAAFIAVGAAIVWGWIQHRNAKAKDTALLDSATKLARDEKEAAADTITDAGALAEARVKAADDKAEQEVQHAISSGSLVGDLRRKSGH
jgi:hypothetical protein